MILVVSIYVFKHLYLQLQQVFKFKFSVSFRDWPDLGQIANYFIFKISSASNFKTTGQFKTFLTASIEPIRVYLHSEHTHIPFICSYIRGLPICARIPICTNFPNAQEANDSILFIWLLFYLLESEPAPKPRLSGLVESIQSMCSLKYITESAFEGK